LQGVIRPFHAHVGGGPAAKLTVDQRDQLGFGGAVAMAGCAEETGDFTGFGHLCQGLVP
jgi:hypothetical protein